MDKNSGHLIYKNIKSTFCIKLIILKLWVPKKKGSEGLSGWTMGPPDKWFNLFYSCNIVYSLSRTIKFLTLFKYFGIQNYQH